MEGPSTQQNGVRPRSQVTARIPDELRERVRRASEESAIPQQDIIIQALDQFLDSDLPVKSLLSVPSVALECDKMTMHVLPGGRIEIYADPRESMPTVSEMPPCE